MTKCAPRSSANCAKSSHSDETLWIGLVYLFTQQRWVDRCIIYANFTALNDFRITSVADPVTFFSDPDPDPRIWIWKFGSGCGSYFEVSNLFWANNQYFTYFIPRKVDLQGPVWGLIIYTWIRYFTGSGWPKKTGTKKSFLEWLFITECSKKLNLNLANISAKK